MTCKDCLHYEVCVIVEHSVSTDEDYLTEFGCEDFKDRSKWVEQKHGRWIEVWDAVSIGKGTHFECSECGTWMHWGRLSKFCPVCGALMRRE